ncbi:MAG: histidine phosphatase family protein [Candidatus Nanopelagicales bacterium]
MITTTVWPREYAVGVTTVMLLRHGRSTANAEGILAGWTPGVGLDDVGQEQARAAARRLQEVRFSAVVTSPLERCRQTADAIARRKRQDLPIHTDLDLAEARYGDWTGQPLTELAEDPLWSAVQHHPSGVTFPGGESMVAVSNRAVSAIRRWNRRLGDKATYVVVSHGDVIKAILADALGMHLDLFQRLQIDPCSVSVIRYTAQRPFVARLNDVGGDLSAFSPGRRRRAASSDAVVGGESGA